MSGTVPSAGPFCCRRRFSSGGASGWRCRTAVPAKPAASFLRRPGSWRCARAGLRSTGGTCRWHGRCTRRRAELAAGAGDAVLAVHVLSNQSMLYAELARTGPSREPARQALRLAFQAQEEGRYIPVPRLHALIALRHASAASLLGDKAAFQAAISQARRELDRGPRDGDPPEWLRFVDETEITGVEARGWLNLGDAQPQRTAVPAGARVRAERPQPGQLRRGPGGRAAEAGRPPGRGRRGDGSPARARRRGDVHALP